MNYVRNIERGKRHPRPEGLLAIAQALRVGPDEFAHWCELAGIASTLLPIPGLSAWQRLPTLLWGRVRHGASPPWMYDAERELVDVVRAAASLLCAVDTLTSQLSDEHAEELRARVAEATESITSFEESIGSAPSVEEVCARASRVVPVTRRDQLFASETWTTDAIARLEWWEYHGSPEGSATFPTPHISFLFSEEPLKPRFDFEFIDVELSIHVHDLITTFALWSQAGLEDVAGPLSPRAFPSPRIRRPVDVIFSGSPPPGMPSNHYPVLWEAEFVCRLYESPPLGEAILRRTRDEVCARIDALGGWEST